MHPLMVLIILAIIIAIMNPGPVLGTLYILFLLFTVSWKCLFLVPQPKGREHLLLCLSPHPLTYPSLGWGRGVETDTSRVSLRSTCPQRGHVLVCSFSYNKLTRVVSVQAPKIPRTMVLAPEGTEVTSFIFRSEISLRKPIWGQGHQML